MFKKREKYKKHEKCRLWVQAFGALIINGDLKNFVDGKIYQGPLKQVCLPVLNCYSCPGALTSCPIGSLQAIGNQPKFRLSFYVIGILFLSGILLGRWFCGWLCPFGLIQELIYKLPIKKIKLKMNLDNLFRKIKFVFLFVFVLFIPSFV
ncbi:MAG: 4Fe-4S binding protein, partial [Clostridiaceae bacterium]|nr:4Fe-4S binding protein [Clostridiaceae bacterium]